MKKKKGTQKDAQGVHVGQVVISPYGMARITALEGDDCQLRVIGDEPRIGDIIAIEADGGGFIPMGDIIKVNPVEHTFTIRGLKDTHLGWPLEIGARFLNLSRDVRLRLQKQFGKEYAEQMSPEAKEELAALGLESAAESSSGITDEELRMFMV